MWCWLYFYIFLVISQILYFSSLFFLFKVMDVFIEFQILCFNSVNVEMAVFLDWVSLMFSSFVFLISSMIILYSKSYMVKDKNLDRFVYIMVLFVLSMMVVIMSSNLVFVLLGWDGLGLVSYILVIYYQNIKSYNAGMLTALSNRVGDSALLVGIALMMGLGGWGYSSYMGDFFLDMNLIMFSVLIVLASFTKSAQIPFSSWLPAAMAAPTPVSALVHSSTLVTAGVYLLFRFSNLLSRESFMVFMYLSLFTMFMAGLAANFEFDLKKVIALSTLSQLGMMMVIFFLGSEDLAFFHLLMHALFKALLFMCAGVIIHSVGGCQDIRYMGGLVQAFPISSACFGVSSLALCGLPFLSGFYSKDLVVEVFSMSGMGLFIYLMFFFSVGLTVSYSMRLLIYVFIGQFNVLSLINLNEKDSSLMLKSMMFLLVLVIFKGSILGWMSFSTPYFIVLPFSMKLMTLLMILFGSLFGLDVLFSGVGQSSSMFGFIHFSLFVSGMWNLPVLSTSSLNSFTLNLGKLYLKNMEFGWAEFYGSKGGFNLISMILYEGLSVIRNHLKIYLLLMWGFLVFIVLLAIV
uniref:NADH-ubiquinone oxidoreductase chain 5 n=1 Tax=Trigonopterus carinirostris TaxID=2576104 RepID=A0A7H1KI12_9CUCU|nr:NADH dehydrogenase subunit 5 [Trigonopterus carinirostris]QNT26928.1 NADH dehydrogenase subunit 5 [Trigonopterus carinirostris]